jgi:hypothetical protein
MQLKSTRTIEEQQKILDDFEKVFSTLQEQYGEDISVKEIEILQTPEGNYVSVCHWTNFWHSVLPFVDYVIINITDENGDNTESHVIEQEKLLSMISDYAMKYEEPAPHYEVKDITESNLQEKILNSSEELQ